MKIRSKGKAISIGAIVLAFTGTMASSRAQNTAVSNTAPELVGKQWFNTGGKPLTLASRQGKVTIVEFWTFGCFNCRNNLPAYARWQKKFAAQGVQIIGVHTPETDSERDPRNVEKFLRDENITYPIITDAAYQNWNRWHQQYWPTVYLVDKAGRVRYRYIGELRNNEAQVTQYIETLLKEPSPSTRA